MTEPSSLPSATHSVPVVDSLAVAPVATAAAAAATGTKPPINGAPAEEEEDYTIKCICDYQDDDGNTVQCETCETWQHIECYYQGEGPGADETHNCVDCEPRRVDKKRALEVQRARRLELDPTDRKVKKAVAPATKGQRRKPKAESVNGYGHEKADGASTRNGASGSPREGATAKRPKATHRSSHSTTHVVPLKQPAASRRSASASLAQQSPSKGASLPESETYSEDFVHLYDDDPGETDMKQNLFGDLKTADALSSWCRDPDSLRRVTAGRSHQEVFFRCEQPVESIATPLVQKQTRLEDSIECHGANPKWVYLTVESQAPRQSMLGILRGKIGFMKDYTQDDTNRWEEVRHPLPFVFFHPTLPIYIDTREQGTIFRYIRRSCKPNVHMKTFLENETDYHFCFVTNEELPPGSELTIAWTFDEHMRRIIRDRDQHAADKIKQESPEDAEYIYDYLVKLAAEFGGCACNDPNGCIFVKYRRPKVEPKMANGKTKRGRKANNKVGNARTASSRSGSEALRYQDGDDDEDAQSTSASSRSKPQSRDMTPSYGAGNELDALGPDVDDRTKRKIAALEKHESDRNQPAPKKKKRNSGGAALGNTATGAIARSDAKSMSGAGVPSTPGINTKSRYVDAGTGRKGSNSPTTPGSANATTRHPKSISAAQSPSILGTRRANYVDMSVQCDMDSDDPPAATVLPRRPFRSLTKQLLQRCHNERLAQRKVQEERTAASSATSPTSQVPASTSPVQSNTELRDADGDVKMEGDNTAIDPSSTSIQDHPRPKSSGSGKQAEASADTSPIAQDDAKPPPTQADDPPPPNGFRAADMHVPMPPKPSFNTPHPTVTIPSTASSTTPSAGLNVAQSPIVQTPTSIGVPTPMLTPGSAHIGGPLVQPSPVKKKLSLGDYISRRAEKAEKAEAAAEKERSRSDATAEIAPTLTAALKAGSTSPNMEPKSLAPVVEESRDGVKGAVTENNVAEAADATPGGTVDTSTAKPADGSDAMDIDSVGKGETAIASNGRDTAVTVTATSSSTANNTPTLAAGATAAT